MEIHEDLKPISDFLKQYKAYDVMPTSAKCIVIESGISVYRAYRIMGENRTSVAYIWDAGKQSLIGVLTIKDIMTAILSLHKYFFSQEKVQDVQAFMHSVYPQALQIHENITILHLLNYVTINSIKSGNSFLHAPPETTLFDALRLLRSRSVHRLPIIDDGGSVLCSMTYRSLCKFLVGKFRLPSKILQTPVLSLISGDRSPCVVRPDATFEEALELMLAHHLSSIPVVNAETNEIIEVFSKYDVAALSMTPENISLNAKIIDLINTRPPQVEGLSLMPETATCGDILKEIATRNIHRVVLVDETTGKHIVAVVSLRHLLDFISDTIAAEKLQPIEQINTHAMPSACPTDSDQST